ncbi:MAG: hypothetical protein WCE53_06165 [Candidatus Acidiferrum sp.]
MPTTDPEASAAEIQPAPPTTTELARSPIQTFQTDIHNDSTPRWKRIGELSVTGATVGLLIINIFLWSATKKAADAARDSIIQVEKNTQLDERAWIGPVDAPIIDWKVGKKFSVAIPVKNTGKTPGTNVTTVMAVGAFNRQKMPTFADSGGW